MKNFGSLLLFVGVGTVVLNLVGYEFRILMWIDNWGETVGWAIRAALIVAGGVLWVLGDRAEKAAAPQVAETPRQEPMLSAAAPEPADPAPPADAAPAADPAAPADLSAPPRDQ